MLLPLMSVHRRPIVTSELRSHRLRQAQDLLQLGVRLNDETFVCAREDGEALQPNSIG